MLSTSLYSCNFLRERRIEIKFLPISSTVYFAPEELDFVSVRLKRFPVCSVKFVYHSGAIFTAENLLSSAARFRRAYSWLWKSRKDSRAKIYYDNLFTAHISIYRQTEYRHVAIVASTIVMFN